MSMSKAIGAGIALTAIGVACIVGGVAAGVPEIKNIKASINNAEVKTTTLDATDYSFDICAANVSIHKTDKEKSYVEYKVLKYFTVEATDSSFNVKINKKNWIFSILGSYNVVDIYIAEDEVNKIDFTLNAGTATLEDEITIKKLVFEQNAGTVKINGLTTDSLELSLNAGTVNIDQSKIKEFDFEVNAGTLVAEILYPEAYYTISTSKNAGTLTINPDNKNHQSGSEAGYSLSGEVNAGTAKITFKE